MEEMNIGPVILNLRKKRGMTQEQLAEAVRYPPCLLNIQLAARAVEREEPEEALEKLATDWLEESVYIIEQKAGILNMVAPSE